MLHAARGGRRWLFGVGWEPLGVVFVLSDPLDFDARELAPECFGAVGLGNVFRGLCHEWFFEDTEQVIGRFLEVLLAVVADATAAIAHAPDRASRQRLGRFDLLGHLVAGVAHLVQCQRGYPCVRADTLLMAMLTSNFGHTNSSPAVYRQAVELGGDIGSRPLMAAWTLSKCGGKALITL